VRGDVNWKGDVFSDHLNSETYKLDELTLFNLFVRYETEDARWSIECYGKNLTDEEYYNSLAAVRPLDPGLQGFIGMPMTYGVRVSYTF